MRSTVGLAVGAVLIALSLLHWVWLFSSKSPGNTVIPTVRGRRAFEPGPLATVAVAVALAVAALLVLWRSQVLPSPLPGRWGLWGCGLVGAAFLLRAVGEFRLVGFFKSVKGTSFATWDTWLYSPLCLLLALGALWLAGSAAPN